MLPFNPGGHGAYQHFVFNQLCKHYPNPDSLPRDTWEIIEHLYQKDLSHLDEMLRERYSVFGPAPRLPSCMFRSYLLSLLQHLDAWDLPYESTLQKRLREVA